MLGNGNLGRYERHHPMSLGDVLAALFRGKPQKAHPGKTQTLLGMGKKPGPAGPEPAVPAKTNVSRETVRPARVQVSDASLARPEPFA